MAHARQPAAGDGGQAALSAPAAFAEAHARQARGGRYEASEELGLDRLGSVRGLRGVLRRRHQAVRLASACRRRPPCRALIACTPMIPRARHAGTTRMARHHANPPVIPADPGLEPGESRDLAVGAAPTRKIPWLRRITDVLRRARDDGWMCACGFGLAAVTPEGLSKSKGARAPKRCDPVATQGSLAAPAPVAMPCRGCGHIVSGLIGPARGASPEPLASRT